MYEGYNIIYVGPVTGVFFLFTKFVFICDVPVPVPVPYGEKVFLVFKKKKNENNLY